MSAFDPQNFSTSLNFQDLSTRLSEPEAQATIVEIANEVSSNQVVKPDIEDDQKRWLIVGICLHSILSPALRQYIPPVVRKLYNTLKGTDKIDTQKFAKYMIRYKPTNKELNYEAINNNSAVAKVKGKKDVQKYNYNVTNEVDLTKLFMQTNMAHYTGFDDTCDSSALLGMIINIDKFPTLVKQVAEKVRGDIRNPWAHCNFSEWDVIRFQNSFQLMHQLIRNLQLPVVDETTILGKLTHWQTNGVQFLQGTTLGIELVKELKKETRALSKYILDLVLQTDESFKEVHTAILTMEGALDKVLERLEKLESGFVESERKLNAVTDTVSVLKDANERNSETTESMKTDIKNVKSDLDKTNLGLADSTQKVVQLESHMDDISLKVTENKTELHDTKTEIIYARADIESTKTEVKEIKSELDDAIECIEKNKLDILDTKADVAKHKADIEDLTKYVSAVRPTGKVFFYPPDRVSTFVSRDYELDQLKEEFQKYDDQHTQVICGLGGVGKTTLAVEYAWTYQSYYPGGVFWMSAETNEALEDSIQRLAIDTNIVGKSAKETITKTLNWLAYVQDRWLLVIDNVDIGEIRGTLKELIVGVWKRKTKGQIIITSRREAERAEEDFHVSLKDCIILDVLTERESQQFMIIPSGYQIDKTDDSLNLLIKELGGLPLAMEQAAAHIKNLKCSFKTYLDKFSRQRLKFLRASKPTFDVSKERQAVRTTWQLNFDYIKDQSEEEGLGRAAVNIMEIAAFLYADEIPLIILNCGSPDVCDEDLLDALQDDVGGNQVAEVLARFSLFNRDRSYLKVHRLVQEVIRENITDVDRKAFVLQCATRMLNMAFKKSQSPREALKEENIGRASLQMWSKLAQNANSLKTYLFGFTKTHENQSRICFNIETATLLQSSAIYHSLFQRQDEALACQAQMLRIIPALSIAETDYKDLTCIKVPLLQKDKQIIQSSITMTLSTDTDPTKTNEPQTSELLDHESLRKIGNEAFKLGKYQDAIQYYSEAVTACQKNVDPKVLTNRSLAYLRISDYENALRDADSCIQKEPTSYKAYCWKAYAIANLIRLNVLPKSWESAGLAAAAIAGFLDNRCLLEYRMKIEYPVVKYIIVENESDFGREISSMMNRAYTTLLLRKGNYKISMSQGEFTTKSVQIIGIEEGVEIHSPEGVALIHPSEISHRFQFEEKINVLFENVTFPTGCGQIFLKAHVNVTFYRCNFSNGEKGCENFPFCKGREGCVNPNPKECIVRSETQENKSCAHSSGLVGYPGICASDGGNALIDTCKFDRCGGGGTLSISGSTMKIRNCEFRNMRQMGVEAREGGFVIVENCNISDNQFHGVAIGPKGNGQVKNCIIQNNQKEGIWSGGNLEFEGVSTYTTKSDGGSTCIIHDNIIYQNGMSGISLDGGSFDVYGNKIFDNWLWGMMVKSRSTTNACNNDIFENKCGGIRIGVNYSASVVLDGNTVRDHTGPAIHTEILHKSMNVVPRSLHDKRGLLESLKSVGMLDDESTWYSLPPIITTRNLFENNNKGQQHPQQTVELLETCCFCQNASNTLKKCSKCKKASYCSKECQKSHWNRHKIICKMILENFTVDIRMSETTKRNDTIVDRLESMTTSRTNAPLQGIGQGISPDKSTDNRFIVKIQSRTEYTNYDLNKELSLSDQTRTLNISFKNRNICHLVYECGFLAATNFTTKKMFCWASFEKNKAILRIHTDSLPPFQNW